MTRVVARVARASRLHKAVWIIGLALMATACGGESEADRTSYNVAVDGVTAEFNANFNRFFPDQLTVHPGDTIVFERPENGEPHTIAIGTEVPDRENCPGCNFFVGGFGSEPRTDTSMPCFLSEGLPSREDGCSADEQQEIAFDGTQSWLNSGGLLGDESYSLDLADDIAPGTYSFFCLVHTSTMKGTIEVVEPEEPADDPAEVVARGEEDLEREVRRILPLVEQTRSGGEGVVLAALTSEPFATWANIFTPDEIEIPTGGTVTWDIRGVHTISFNAPESARPLYERAEDRSVRENESAATPAGDPSAWGGSGFLNSGRRDGLFPPAKFSVTFTNPGTYTYFCLIHFDMEGKVKVVG